MMLIFKLRVYSYDIIKSKGYFENERRIKHSTKQTKNNYFRLLHSCFES